MLYFSPNLLEEAWRLFSHVKAIVCSTLYMHFEFSYCYLKYTSFVQYIHNKFCLENWFCCCIRFALKSVLVYWTTNSRELVHAPTSIKGAHPCTHINVSEIQVSYRQLQKFNLNEVRDHLVLLFSIFTVAVLLHVWNLNAHSYTVVSEFRKTYHFATTKIQWLKTTFYWFLKFSYQIHGNWTN